ncbi:cysteine desulfurase [bacterium]|nr:cysteine desulfurase [bacterium]
MNEDEVPCTPLSPEEVRPDFPQLNRRIGDYPLAYLDNTAATLKPRQVIEAIDHFYATCPANVHRGIHTLSEEATDAYESSRKRIAAFIHAPRESELIFTRNTTEGINLVADCWARRRLKPGDEVLVTVMEHHANLIPWQIVTEATGATLKFARLHPSGQLDLDDWYSKLSERTKFVSMPQVSNVLGVINPVKTLTAAAKAVGATVLVDAAQSVPHMPVDVVDIGCDFLAFSGYKLLGPFGIGGLWGRYELLDAMPPYQTGGSMIHTVTLEKTTFADPPQRFEAGTPSIADAVGFAAAIDYLTNVGMDRLHQREIELSKYMHERLAEIPGLRILGEYFEGKPGIASFDLAYAHAHDVAQFLSDEGVAVRAGHHCAEPLHHEFNSESTSRASLYLYNTEAEIDQLIAGLGTVREIFG